MPMKWTAENNELLLLKILETHDIKLNTALIVAAWPTDKGEAPTPRAITERLVTIRKNLGVPAKGKMSITATPPKVKAGIETPVTPRSFKAVNNGSSGSAKKKTLKRKLLKAEPKDGYDSDTSLGGLSPNELSSLGNGHNQPNYGDDAMDNHETPTKRARSRRASVKPTKYDEDEGESGMSGKTGESDVSNFEVV